MKTLYKNFIAVLFLALACVACNKDKEEKGEEYNIDDIVIADGKLLSPQWLINLMESVENMFPPGCIFYEVHFIKYQEQKYILFYNGIASTWKKAYQFYTCSGTNVEFESSLYNNLRSMFNKRNYEMLYLVSLGGCMHDSLYPLEPVDCNNDKESESVITMTQSTPNVSFFLRGCGFVTVNWGDGTQYYTKGLSSNNSANNFYHEYSGTKSRTVNISGDNLTYLDCIDSQLTSLDVSQNTVLERLSCYNNQLTSLDVNKNPLLTYLNCNDNKLTSLDVGNNTTMTNLSCSSNQLTSLDVSKNTELTSLGCSNNQLTSLDVSRNTKLKDLFCVNSQLASLDVSKNIELNSLLCNTNQLANLDVCGNTVLTSLYCSNNQLTSLDVSKNTKLAFLDCSNNQLTSLDVSGNTMLRSLDCSNNQLTGVALNALFETLPSKSGLSSIYIGNNPGTNDCDFSIARDKGWGVYNANN